MFDGFDSTPLRMAILGTGMLGLVSGALGSFAVIRRQSLLGDAISHAALPGVVLGFLLPYGCALALTHSGADATARMLSDWAGSPMAILLGAAVAGWVGTCLVGIVVRHTRIPFDAALGGVLSVFFGFGMVLLTWLQHHVPCASAFGLERYLFGNASGILESDLWAIGIVGGAALLLLSLFWKELKLLCFDPGYASANGFPVQRLDLLLTTLLVIAVVIGLQSVGVVLMSAMIVAPASAARQWTDRLGTMVVLAGVFGAAAGIVGSSLAHALSERGRSIPTGPTIVLCATLWVLVSLSFAPRHGWLRKTRSESEP